MRILTFSPILAILLSVTPFLSFSQIHISGPLSGVLVDTTYIVDGDISVEVGDSLVIEAGAELLFEEGMEFNVRGYLRAIGTEMDSILFVPIIEQSLWAGIYLYNSSVENCEMEYCVVIGGMNGIECYYANLIIKNSLLFNNFGGDGGGIECKYSDIEIIDCDFRENTANGYGGAIRLHDSNSIISGCTFLNNTGSQGGGIRGVGGSHFISGCYFGGNSVTNRGGGVYMTSVDTLEISGSTFLQNFSEHSGGGICIISVNEIFISDCLITGNVVSNDLDHRKGGGLSIEGGNILITNTEVYNNSVQSPWSYGGGLNIENTENCSLDSLYIHENYSQYFGGGIRSEDATLVISNSLIENNHASSWHGGGAYFILSEITMNNCIISNNSGSDHGGGVYGSKSNLSINNCEFSSNHTAFFGRGGGLFFNFDSLLSINNSVFYGNYADNGSAIETDHSANCVIKNSIFAENYDSEAIKFDDNDYKEISYSSFYNNEGIMGSIYYPPTFGIINYTNLNGDSCDIYGNIFLDPLFQATIGDSAFRLTADSPCIDAGNPESPLDPDSTIADIGAYYYNHNTWVKPGTESNAPSKFALYPTYPNPFNQTSVVRYQLSADGLVSLSVYDITGREVVKLVDGFRVKGSHQVKFDGKDLASGIYFIRLEAQPGAGARQHVMVQKALLVK